jgi:hypothetical protein
VKSQACPHQVSGWSRSSLGQVPDKSRAGHSEVLSESRSSPRQVWGESRVGLGQVPAKSRQGPKHALIRYVNLRIRCLKLENGLQF